MGMLLNFIRWNVRPEIFPNLGWSPRWYGVLFALGFILGYYIILSFYKKEDIKQQVLDSLTMYMFFGTILGARLGHCLFYEPSYYLSHPLKILFVWEGGLASHGAGIGIIVALILFSRKQKKPFLWVFDHITLVTALAGCCIRLGNLMNSEIVGNRTDKPWGFVFEQLGEDFARHPSQLYEAMAYLLIFFFLYYVYTQTKYGSIKGVVSGLFLILVFGFRFFIEFTKEVQVGFEKGMALDMGQLLSVPFVLAGILLVWFSINKNNDELHEVQ